MIRARGFRPAGAPSSVLALIFAGCASVLGLDDLEIEPWPADGGAGAGPDASAAGTAGATGTEGGEGGEHASGGQSGAGGLGAAGAAGEPENGVGCDGVTPFSPNLDVVRSCVLRTSCHPFAPHDPLSRCVSWNTLRAFRSSALGCALDATSCVDVALCEGKGWALDELCLGQTGWRCEGELAVDCTGRSYVDCAQHGGTCAILPSGVAGCRVLEACTASAGPVCGGPADGFLYECVDGAGYGLRCANFGLVCDGAGGARCRPDGPSCAEPGTVSCSSGMRRACSADGRREDYSCSSVGLGCAEQECLAPGCTAEDVASCSERCDGARLSFCYGGAPFSVDCTDYGFPTCRVGTHPEGWSYAACSY